jgi:hypothetical protein
VEEKKEIKQLIIKKGEINTNEEINKEPTELLLEQLNKEGGK